MTPRFAEIGRLLVLSVLCGAFVLPGGAAAGIKVVGGVSPGSSGNINCTGNPQSSQNGYATVQGAIDAASSGDSVVICPGTYSENNINVNKSGLTIVSKDNDATTVTVQHTGSNPNTPLVIVSQPNAVLRAVNFVSRYSYPAVRTTSAATGLWLDAIRASSSHDTIDLQANNTRISSLIGSTSGAWVSVVNLNNTTGFAMDGVSMLTATANTNGRGIFGGNGTANSPTISGATINAGGYGIYLQKGGTLTISNSSVSATSGYGIYLLGGSGNHTLTNLTVAGTTGYGVYLEGGTTAVLTDVDASSNQNYAGALHFMNISGGVTIAKSAKTTLTYSNPANNGYGIYLENSPGLTFSNANITTGNVGIYQKGSNGGRFALSNLVVTASRDAGIYIEGGSGAHTFTHMSVSGAAGNSGGMYLNGGTSATFADVDAIATGSGSNYGAALTVRGITGSISIDKAVKSGVSFTTPSGNIYGLFLCPASGSNATVQVANATVSAGLSGIYIGYSNCGNSTVTLRNLTVSSSGSHGILVNRGVGNHVLDNITSTGNGPGGGTGVTVDGGSGATLTDVDATVSGNGNWQSALYINAIAGPVSIDKAAKSSVSYTGTGTNVYGVRVCNASSGTLAMRNARVRSYLTGLYVGAGGCANGALTLSNLDIVSTNGHGIDAAARGTHSVDTIAASGANSGIKIDGTGLGNSTNSTYSNLTATGGSNGAQYVYGVYLGWQTGARLTGVNTITGKGRDNVGIYLDACATCTISGATIDMTSQTGYTRGISLVNSSSNATITGNYIKNAYAEGIYANSSNPSVIGNIVENSARQSWTYGVNMNYNGPAYNNCLYNTSNGLGTRFYDSTSQTGNFWGSWPKGSGYSDTCTDANNNGRCDTRYSYQSGNYDEYPLKRCDVSMTAGATLIAEYHLEEGGTGWLGSTGEVKDTAGYTGGPFNGQATGSPLPSQSTATPARAGRPGTCGYATLPGPSSGGGAFGFPGLPVVTTAGEKTSVAFWMYWDGTNGVMPISWNNYDLFLNNGSFGFNSFNSDVYGIASTGLANGWHHVAAVFVNGNVVGNELYIDGVRQTLTQRSGSPNNGNAVVSSTLRTGVDSYRFTGRIDEIKVYRGGLTQTQVTALYSETHACPAMMIADWRMDELTWNGASGEVRDHSGHDLNGKAMSGATIATTASGRLCRGGMFDNKNYAEIPDSASLQLATGYTIAGWIKTSKGSGTIISKTGTSSPWSGYVFALGPDSGGKLSLWNGTGSWYTSTGAAVNDGGWHHVAVTVNGTSLQYYVDGLPNGSAITLSGTTTASTSPLRVGYENNPGGASRYFSGQLDELNVWDGALTAPQIAAGYANEVAGRNWDGSTRTCIALLGEYRMEETSWNGTTGELKDSSGNNRHGVAIGSPKATPATASPARTGNPGTCGYGTLPGPGGGGGAFSIPNLPLSTTANGNKTTVTFWMYWDGRDSVMPIGWRLHDLWLVSGSFGFNTAQGDVYGIASTGLANGWHHVAAVFTNGSVVTNELYIDGLKQTLSQRRNSPSNTNAVVNTTLQIGGWQNDSDYRFSGRIDDVRVYAGALGAGDIAAIYQATHTCPSALDHIRIEHDGSGLTCQREPVIIKACQNADCSTQYSGGDVSLTLSPAGWYTAATGGSETNTLTLVGGAQVTRHLQKTTTGNVTLGITGTVTPAPANGVKCFSGSTETCTLAFADAGLIFTADTGTGAAATIPTQTSGVQSGQLYVRAARNDGTGQCVSAVSGGTATLGHGCDDPGTCSSGNWLGTTGTLTFDANGYAPFKFTFNDAGKIHLTASATASAGGTLTGSSNIFVVKPAALCVSSTDLTPCAAADATCAAVKKAGESFNLTTTAVRSGYDCASASTYVTPNYQATGITLGSETVAPTGGAGEGGVLGVDITSGGSAVVSQSISEVGVFKFTATPPSYFGETIGSPPFKTGALGRFTPDHFDVTVAGNGALATACGSTFTYTGQPMGYGTAPSLTIKAMNGLATPGPTTNYTGAFQTLTAADVTITAPTADATQNGRDGATKTALSATLNAGTLTNSSGTMTYTLASGDRFTYTRNANSLIGPYTAAVRLPVSSIADSDTVTKAAGATWPTLAPTGVPLRYGRLRLLNFYGSELLPARVDYRVEHWDGSRWTTNGLDSCSAVAADNIASGGLTVSATQPPAYSNGVGTITFDAAAVGQYDIAINLNASGNDTSCNASHPVGTTAANKPWLQGSWGVPANCNSAAAWSQDPNARIKFGSPKAPYIYLRERY